MRCLSLVCGLVLATSLAPRAALAQGADWELRVLGVADDDALREVASLAGRRVVTLAVVGEGGASQSLLAPLLGERITFEYRGGASDPNAETHDTGQLRVILDLASKLGLYLRVLVYQPPDDFALVGEALAQAGREADIVVCFHSFWGGAGVEHLAEQVRVSTDALFIAPYGEIGEPRTGTSWQGRAAKPDGGGIANFVTCIPLARQSHGELLTPSSRDAEDTETINFVAPSYYASGPGGTCPSAATTAVLAGYIVAASKERPAPVQVVALLRDSATVDAAALLSVPDFVEADVARLCGELDRLIDPARNGGQRKLDAQGVLSLRRIYRALARPEA